MLDIYFGLSIHTEYQILVLLDCLIDWEIVG